MYQEKKSIISNQEVMPGVHMIRLDSSDIAKSARPGQFVMMTCDNDFKRLLRRPLSIHQIDGTIVSFLFSIISKGTDWLASRQVGEKISFLGPLGNGFNVNPKSRNLLLVAGGMGIAPLCFLAGNALKSGFSIKILIGAKNTCQIYPTGLIPSGADIIIATEDGSMGEKGMVTALVSDYLQWADQIFACGPLPMYKTMAKQDHLVSKSIQVSLEIRMGCGMGFCYACTVKTRQGLKQVCSDGPVFNLQDVLWDELK